MAIWINCANRFSSPSGFVLKEKEDEVNMRKMSKIAQSFWLKELINFFSLLLLIHGTGINGVTGWNADANLEQFTWANEFVKFPSSIRAELQTKLRLRQKPSRCVWIWIREKNYSLPRNTQVTHLNASPCYGIMCAIRTFIMKCFVVLFFLCSVRSNFFGRKIHDASHISLTRIRLELKAHSANNATEK